MKLQIMKTYVLMVSEVFPKTHKKALEKTNFIEKISNKEKIHTIRGSLQFWEKRFEEIEKGNACLSIRVWEGTAYKSKQIEKFRFTKSDGIGIQKLTFQKCFLETGWIVGQSGFPDQLLNIVAKNDGLSKEDFREWFKNYDLPKPMGIIHFTNFRY